MRLPERNTMNKLLISAACLLLVLMPAQVFADEELSGDVVAPEAAEIIDAEEDIEDQDETQPLQEDSSTEDLQEPDSADDAVQDNPDGFECLEDTTAEVIPDEVPVMPTDNTSEDNSLSAEPDPYISAASVVKKAIDSNKEYVDISAYGLVDINSLENALLTVGAIKGTVESFDVLEENGHIVAVVISYTAKKPTSDQMTSERTTSEEPEELAPVLCTDICVAEASHAFRPVSEKSSPVQDRPDGLLRALACFFGSLLGLLKMIGGAL